MAEEPLDSQRPPDEAWWERELHRIEKLMEKYRAAAETQGVVKRGVN